MFQAIDKGESEALYVVQKHPAVLFHLPHSEDSSSSLSFQHPPLANHREWNVPRRL